MKNKKKSLVARGVSINAPTLIENLPILLKFKEPGSSKLKYIKEM